MLVSELLNALSRTEQKRVGTNRNTLQRKQREEELIRTRGSKEYVGRFAGTGAEAFRVIVVGATGDHRS